MAQIVTKTGENTITFDAYYQYIWARNYGETDVYISNHADIVAGDDDVALLPAGEAVRLTVNGNTLYVLGSTTLEVHAQNFSDSPFAWNEAGEGGGSDITVVALSATENRTYTAPSGTAYSPVTVNVPIGAEIITRSDWNALTTAQKQAKGLVAIQDSSTGFKRGDFVNGADYIDTLLTYSNYSDILEEDKSTSHVSGTDVWGNLTLSGNMSNDADGAVVTNNGGIFFDLTAANTSVTLYFLAKVISAPSSISTITAIPYSESYGNMPNMYGDGTNVYAGAYGSGTLLSGIVSTGYHLYTVALDTTSKIATFYADGERYAQLQFSNSGDYIAIGTATKGLLTPLSLAVKYIGIVNGHEDMLTILNNQSAIMGAFGL